MLNGELHAEFDALLSTLRENFQPVGTFEECSAEMLGATRWRQRRVLLAEAAEIEA